MPAQPRVLVVDDEPTIREIIADALRESGFDVRSAANGAYALDLLRGWVPQVIVLDLMMPRMDGVGFSESLRRNPRLAAIPLLLVTAAYAPHAAAERIGARATLTKPFELDDLVDLVVEFAGRPPAPPRRRSLADKPVFISSRSRPEVCDNWR